MWLKTNMADNSLLCPQIPVQNPGFLYRDIVDGSISSALKQTPCYLFLRARPFLLRLVKHNTNDCLYSGILNEYITEFTKQFE